MRSSWLYTDDPSAYQDQESLCAEQLTIIRAHTELPPRGTLLLSLKIKLPLTPGNLILTYLCLQLYVDTALDSSPPRGNVT